ncbi:hypothetical protein H257_04277 [Aphanomyces astaci]|uniref:Uncharacterized protein n=1 Tax=Aphanomyces astaci TaxID=112090 RepID=W4GX61_APHAT|nr:hypothetical protein H257_04277 [Aphanomyces astaci]ETV83579.1 hypothetical protein H257_04277 [Aphanomyces astaci]|eukprot:XP_009827009.1 hypothetical protein H257_04277 [Aphanomyces astaci]
MENQVEHTHRKLSISSDKVTVIKHLQPKGKLERAGKVGPKRTYSPDNVQELDQSVPVDQCSTLSDIAAITDLSLGTLSRHPKKGTFQRRSTLIKPEANKAERGGKAEFLNRVAAGMKDAKRKRDYNRETRTCMLCGQSNVNYRKDNIIKHLIKHRNDAHSQAIEWDGAKNPLLPRQYFEEREDVMATSMVMTISMRIWSDWIVCRFPFTPKSSFECLGVYANNAVCLYHQFPLKRSQPRPPLQLQEKF